MSQLKYYDSVSGTWKALLAGAQGPQGPTGPQGTAGVVSITYGSSPPATGNTTGSMWIDSVEGVLYTYIDDGDSQQWVDFTTPATLGYAANVYGGMSNALLYQSAVSNTVFLSPGTTGQMLSTDSNGAPYWTAQSSLTIANTQISGYITTSQIASVANTKISGYITVSGGGTGATSFTPASSGIYGLIMYDGTKLTTDPSANVYNCGFSPTSNTFYATDTFFAGNSQITSLGVGTSASGVLGEILAANNITAYYSDERLKTDIRPIDNPIEKIMSISGVYYRANETAENYGYKDLSEQVGVIAQQVQKVLPHVIKPAPFDTDFDEQGKIYSKSGENYLTVQYERIIPLLIEAIKDQQNQINELKDKLNGS